MKKLTLILLPLVLAACATESGTRFADNPQQYGLFVAAANVFTNTPIAVKNTATGEMVKLTVKHYESGDVGYVVESLPAGHYQLEGYSPDGVNPIALETANGYFEVQDNCFNYGGEYDFGVDANGNPSYTNSTTLKDIEKLPHTIRKYAEGRDICSAAMGKASERLAAADVQSQLDL
jgi:hypothetical protein